MELFTGTVGYVDYRTSYWHYALEHLYNVVAKFGS